MIKLNCINISTVNVDEMREFYSLVLNAPANGSHGEPHRYEIPTGDAWIVICRSNHKPDIPSDHCGLEFAVNDIDTEYERLLSAGIKIGNAPVTYPWGWKAFGCKDPDGNNIDFVQYVG